MEDLKKELLEYGFLEHPKRAHILEMGIHPTELTYRVNLKEKWIGLVANSEYIGNTLKPNIPEWSLDVILANFTFITGWKLNK